MKIFINWKFYLLLMLGTIVFWISSSSTIPWWRYTDNRRAHQLTCESWEGLRPALVRSNLVVRPNHSGAQFLCNFLQSWVLPGVQIFQQFSEHMHVRSWDIAPTLIQNLNFIKQKTNFGKHWGKHQCATLFIASAYMIGKIKLSTYYYFIHGKGNI